MLVSWEKMAISTPLSGCSDLSTGLNDQRNKKIIKRDQTSELIDPRFCYLHKTCHKKHPEELRNIQLPDTFWATLFCLI